MNGSASDLTAIVPTGSSGGGFTCCQLRDLKKKLAFSVGWTAEKSVFIETNKTYSGN